MIIFPILCWALLGLVEGRSMTRLRNAELLRVYRSNRTSVGLSNTTDPFSIPFTVSNGTKYRLALISDLDKYSKKEKKCSSDCSWISYLQEGYLTYNPKTASVQWDKNPVQLSSKYSFGSRGMELSELVVFNGKLLTMDDRTGIIFELDGRHNELYPWAILSDGDGHSPKGFKAEWATVKDETLYVGSHGKEIITSGKVEFGQLWVKTVSTTGEVKHLDWKNNYVSLLRAQQIEAPGYLKHESCVWSPVNKRWYFLPRTSSKQAFNKKADERLSTNVLLSADPDFSNITVTHVGEIVPTRGYSSVKFIPGTNDTAMVALKVEEINDKQSTYITVFTTSGKIILPETKVADYKYEGIEFV